MEYTSMSINQLTITPKKLISINELAKEAGFNYSVLISEKLLNKITKPGYENLNVFLKVCAKQLKISLTDSKNWKKTRLFYPMECFNGSLNPEEVVITTQNGDVAIAFAFENAEVFSTPL